MANTYFELEKSVTVDGRGFYPDYTNDYRLSLTAFVGGDNHTQLTVVTNSTLSGQGGVGYIVLSDKDVDLLIAGLLERKLSKISATGNEQSNYCPPKD